MESMAWLYQDQPGLPELLCIPARRNVRIAGAKQLMSENREFFASDYEKKRRQL